MAQDTSTIPYGDRSGSGIETSATEIQGRRQRMSNARLPEA